MRCINQRRSRLKITLITLVVFLLYFNIQFIIEGAPVMLTGHVTGTLSMCIDQDISFPSVANQSVVAKQRLLFDLNVTSEGSFSTLNYVANTSLFSINASTGVIDFTPRDDQTGIYAINITVSNGQCSNNDSSVILNLEVTPSNYAPTLYMGNQVLFEEVAYTYNVTLNATDRDNDTLRFYDDTSLFVVGEDSGIIAFTPTQDQVGTYTVRIYVIDTKDLLGYQDVTFTINNVNDVPELSAIGAQTAYVGEPWNVTLSVIDVDTDENLTFRSNNSNFFSSSGPLPLVSNNTVTYNLNFTTNWTSNGTYSINVTVSDTAGAEDSEVISYTILQRNRAPTIDTYTPSTLGLTLLPGEIQVFNATASDPDETIPSLKWFIGNTYTNITTNNYSYSSGVSGIFNISLIATDGLLNKSLSWLLTVSPASAGSVSGAGGAVGGSGGGGPSRCKELWTCTDWSQCALNGLQTRDCEDFQKCGSINNKPNLTQSCEYIEFPTCFDGVKNQNEILVDCGGVCKECESCQDGIQNQNEEGIDCGGSCSACVHQEQPRLLGNFRDTIIAPLEIFNYPTESWAFWALVPVTGFVVYKVALLLGLTSLFAIGRRRKLKLRRGKKIIIRGDNLTQVKQLIKLTEKAMKQKDYADAHKTYKQIENLYEKLSPKDKKKVYKKISKLAK